MKWISKQSMGFERDVGCCETLGIPVEPPHGAAVANPLTVGQGQ